MVLNLLAPLIVGGVARGLYTNFDQAVSQSVWRCRAGGVIECSRCNNTIEWCTATAKCAEDCKGGNVGAPVCTDGWCSNRTCVDCLLHHNGSVPPVDTTTSIESTDGLQLCTGMSFFVCMHLWMTFIPVVLMVLLASMFLLYEATSRAPAHHNSNQQQQPGSLLDAPRGKPQA